MRLVQIQDIGGCRAIVSTIEHVYKLVSIVASTDEARSSRGVKHKLVYEKDYIKTPKTSGYRGIHQVFKYQSDKGKSPYDGLKIEIQFRTLIQHAWATAVETVGIFIEQALKSSIGQPEWLRFFILSSSAMASYEGCQPVPDISLTPDEIRSELRRYYSELDVSRLFKTYGIAIDFMGKRTEGAKYFLLELNAEENRIMVKSYKKSQIEKASADYLEVEKRIKNKNADAVLVSADSVNALKKAYPNYFLDTEIFLDLLKKIIA